MRRTRYGGPGGGCRRQQGEIHPDYEVPVGHRRGRNGQRHFCFSGLQPLAPDPAHSRRSINTHEIGTELNRQGKSRSQAVRSHHVENTGFQEQFQCQRLCCEHACNVYSDTYCQGYALGRWPAVFSALLCSRLDPTGELSGNLSHGPH